MRWPATTLLPVALLAGDPCPGDRPAPAAGPPQAADADRVAAAARDDLVRQLEANGIRDARVLAALRAVPRERFVPEGLRDWAYVDHALPIGEGQTISQPFVVAYMIQSLALRGGERVLEVGSGSGYAASVLSHVAGEVFGIEIEPVLYARSVETLRALGIENVHLRRADGFGGWPEQAPFDAIVISFAVDALPPPLWEQLAVGGRVVYPEGPADRFQELVVATKTPHGRKEKRLEPVKFVPMQREPG